MLMSYLHVVVKSRYTSTIYQHQYHLRVAALISGIVMALVSAKSVYPETSVQGRGSGRLIKTIPLGLDILRCLIPTPYLPELINWAS